VVAEPARWNLSGGFPAPAAAKDQYGPETEFYMIAAFHQMHCLVSPNKSPAWVSADNSQVSLKEYFDMVNHVLDNQDFTVTPEKLQKSLKNDPTHEHYKHCFIYLRQSLLCLGDTTVEPAIVRDGVRIGEYTAWGLGRECRDWNAIADFATENQYDPWATEGT
jgi:hypothetical protein